MATATKTTEVKVRVPRAWKVEMESIANVENLTLSDIARRAFTRYLRNNGTRKSKTKSK